MREIIKGYDGICFIGDVHLASKRPGRRQDNYAAAGLDKLRQCAQICKERNLFPVGLGDLFHRATENDNALLLQLMLVLEEFSVPLPMLTGSHDRSESWFTEKDACQMLAHTKHLSLMDQAGLAYSLEIKGQRVDIWATPAGCVLPTSIDAESGVRNIMITHDDFDFKGMYPGAHELHEIENCDMLVNGHMHHPTPMVLKGRTACHNPGSIMRVAIDLRDHQPVVSVWSPAHGVSLESVPLVVTANVFDMTGYEADAATPKELRAALPKGLRLSSFAAQLRVNDSLEAARTDDGSVLIESLAGYFKQFEKPDNLKRYLTQLVDETLKDREVA